MDLQAVPESTAGDRPTYCCTHSRAGGFWTQYVVRWMIYLLPVMRFELSKQIRPCYHRNDMASYFGHRSHRGCHMYVWGRPSCWLAESDNLNTNLQAALRLFCQIHNRQARPPSLLRRCAEQFWRHLVGLCICTASLFRSGPKTLLTSGKLPLVPRV